MVGLSDPSSVYNHPDAIAHPVKWAAIHALFVTGAGLAAIVAWRLNEEYRGETEHAYRKAQKSERSMAEAQELAGVGGFDYDLRSLEVKWSEQLFKVFGFDPAGPQPSGDDHTARIDAADREPMRLALEQAIADRETLNEQYRYLHPDGSTRVIHIRAEVVYERRRSGAAGRHMSGRDRARARPGRGDAARRDPTRGREARRDGAQRHRSRTSSSARR